jgi:NAD(P) transhydrogenase subunit alpha
VELPLDTAEAEGAGGYAKAQDEEFLRQQRELLARVIAQSDVLITTALVPGQPAPLLVTKAMVEGMAPGSIVVDIAAEQGGNCEVTHPGQTYQHNGVTIAGPLNLPGEAPYHASQLYARNMATYVLNLVKEGEIRLDTGDEIIRDTLVSNDGAIVNSRVKAAFDAKRAPRQATPSKSKSKKGGA